MLESYDINLVLTSIVVAMVASYTALDLAGRVTHSKGRAARLWLVGGAFAMGAGIWSMHFIGMLAFRLPIRLAYDLRITLASLVIAILTSGFALALVSREKLGGRNLLIGGLIMGAGICGMHYTGMAAMRMFPAIRYDPLLFSASVVIAVVASIAALWLAFTLRTGTSRRTTLAKMGAAIVMGFAITGMHYTGMAAADFDPRSICTAVTVFNLANNSLGYSIALIVLAILSAALMTSVFDAQLSTHTARMLRSVEAANEELKREIAERARTQAQLEAEVELRKEVETRFRTLLESAPDAMVIINRDGRIELVNAQAERIFGYARTELIGQLVELLVPQRLRGSHPGHRTDYFHTPKTRPMGAGLELWGVRKDGTEFPIEISLSPMETPDGLFATAAVRDITERRAAEEKLARYAENLKQSNQELEQFAYVASHDLQAPLRNVVSFSQLLEVEYEKHFDAQAKQYMHYIVQSGTQMQLLIKDLLAFSRVGRIDSQMVSTDVEAELKQVEETMKAVVEARGIQITHDPLPRVSGSPHEIIQLLQNLIGNAIKFQPGDKPRIHISAKREGPDWKFSVRDWGIGIKPEHQHKIFQIFQRLHSVTEYEGTGIGLALCQKIVTRHGGRIWVESEPGKGATFYFTLLPA